MLRFRDPSRRTVQAAGVAAMLATLLVLGGTAAGLAQIVPPLAVPPAPAAAPPAPPVLSPDAAPATASAGLVRFGDIPLPTDFVPLPEGGWRLQGSLGQGIAEGADARALGRLARAMADRTTGRVTVVARVAGPADDASTARRNSLAHAQALKAVLEAGGLPGTRIDLRPMGHPAAEAPAQDSLDLLPPPAPRAGAQTRTP
ncbi:hypothetical protein LPC08_08430 [Roseomonas sp. OT10]|uniref:hypothetical protein n=1 Tax=Roseomonas cutis TaxID=2897332 RepID=UPI001E631977|nr:hypothetical protein [Roseomonas sp. OT10]UFN50627.1 hypothetical protein LPC08_08430 [Roseomonas sp. OT10]